MIEYILLIGIIIIIDGLLTCFFILCSDVGRIRKILEKEKK